MLKNQRFKMFLTTFLIVALVIFGITSAGFAFRNPPVPPAHYQGPAMVGTLVATYTETDPVNQTGILHVQITVNSKGQTLSATGDYEVYRSQVQNATPADLENMELDPALAIQLDPTGAKLNILNVIKFTNTGTVIIADIVILHVEDHP